MSAERFCTINGRQYRVGDVVLDLRPGGAAPLVRVQPVADDLLWYVIQTNPNCEERASGGLRERGYEVYQPAIMRQEIIPERKRVPRGPSKQWVRRPMMPGYLLLGAASPSWYDISRTDGVRRGLGNDGIRQPLQARELDLVRAIEARDEAKALRKPFSVTDLKIGQRLRITDGPFAQFCAEFVEMADEDRIRVLLDIFGQRSKLEIGFDQIERLAG